MTKFRIYKLHFKAPLHISDLRDDASISQKTIHSDTLHAALISCLAKAGKTACQAEKENTVLDDGDLGCVISDLFPYYQKDKQSAPVYFLPMPLQARLPQLDDPADAKKVKRVQWVDARLYSRLLCGKRFFSGDSNDLRLIQSCYMTATTLPEDAKGSKDFIKSEVMQRVAVKDRTGQSDAQPYYVDRISFCDESGLYFLVAGDNTAMLDEALKILEMEGIGTDRYVGYGFFETISEDAEGHPLTLELDTPAKASHQVSLSMFIPESEDQLKQLLSSDGVAYDFTRRGGWMTTPPYNSLRKNAVYAFLPGSVFRRVEDKACLGQVAELTPTVEGQTIDHHVWRNGKSIMLPIII